MKRVLAIAIAVVIATILLAACTDPGKPAETTAEKTDAELSAYIDSKLADIKYDGVIYLTHNGNVVYSDQ